MSILRIITFDESGNFEIPDRNIRLVGGLAIQCEIGVESESSESYVRKLNDELGEFLQSSVNGYNQMLRDKNVVYRKDGKEYQVSVSYPESLHTKRGETYFYMDSRCEFHGIDDIGSMLKNVEGAPVSTFGSYINRRCLQYIKSKGMGLICYTYPFRDNENVVEEINSNITSSEVGANLYVRMASLLMSNSIFYYFDDTPDVYHLKLATRSLPKSLQSVSELGNQATSDNRYYHITDQGIYKNVLSSEIYDRPQDGRFAEADYHFGVSSINYMTATPDMPIFYLSDTICSYLQFIYNSIVDSKKNIGTKEAEEVYTKIRFQAGPDMKIELRYYDKSDLLYREMYRAAEEASLAKLYELEYTMYKNSLKGEVLKTDGSGEAQRARRDYDLAGYYYRRMVPQLETYLKELLKRDDFRAKVLERFPEYLDYTEGFMGRGDEFAYDKGLYMIEKLYGLTEELPSIGRRVGQCLFRLNSIRLRALNHKGAVKELLPIIDECEKYRGFVNPFEYMDFKISAAQVYFNSFEYDKAKDVFLKDASEDGSLLTTLDMLETAIKGLTGDAGNQSLAMSGKILSSLGQAYAFKGETEEAEKWFKAALEKWGDDSGNANITLSYLLHLYIEAGMKEEYEVLAGEYFGYFASVDNTRRSQLAALRSAYEAGGFIRYAFFVYIKAFSRFYQEKDKELIQDIFDFTAEMEKNVDTSGSPWQNIYKYLYRLAKYRDNKKLMQQFSDRILEAVRGDATISVIKLDFELEQYLEENESVDITMNDFMNQSKLRDLGLGSTAGSDIAAILSEFSCFDGIGSMKPAEAKALIDEKLTYMYD